MTDELTFKCIKCAGEGGGYVGQYEPDGTYQTYWVTCRVCKGKGTRSVSGFIARLYRAIFERGE